MWLFAFMPGHALAPRSMVQYIVCIRHPRHWVICLILEVFFENYKSSLNIWSAFYRGKSYAFNFDKQKCFGLHLG
jgi:hypothetical protein